jgi:hypothetical protein
MFCPKVELQKTKNVIKIDTIRKHLSMVHFFPFKPNSIDLDQECFGPQPPILEFFAFLCDI